MTIQLNNFRQAVSASDKGYVRLSATDDDQDGVREVERYGVSFFGKHLVDNVPRDENKNVRQKFLDAFEYSGVRPNVLKDIKQMLHLENINDDQARMPLLARDVKQIFTLADAAQARVNFFDELKGEGRLPNSDYMEYARELLGLSKEASAPKYTKPLTDADKAAIRESLFKFGYDKFCKFVAELTKNNNVNIAVGVTELLDANAEKLKEKLQALGLKADYADKLAKDFVKNREDAMSKGIFNQNEFSIIFSKLNRATLVKASFPEISDMDEVLLGTKFEEGIKSTVTETMDAEINKLMANYGLEDGADMKKKKQEMINYAVTSGINRACNSMYYLDADAVKEACANVVKNVVGKLDKTLQGLTKSDFYNNLAVQRKAYLQEEIKSWVIKYDAFGAKSLNIIEYMVRNYGYLKDMLSEVCSGEATPETILAAIRRRTPQFNEVNAILKGMESGGGAVAGCDLLSDAPLCMMKLAAAELKAADFKEEKKGISSNAIQALQKLNNAINYFTSVKEQLAARRQFSVDQNARFQLFHFLNMVNFSYQVMTDKEIPEVYSVFPSDETFEALCKNGISINVKDLSLCSMSSKLDESSQDKILDCYGTEKLSTDKKDCTSLYTKDALPKLFNGQSSLSLNGEKVEFTEGAKKVPEKLVNFFNGDTVNGQKAAYVFRILLDQKDGLEAAFRQLPKKDGVPFPAEFTESDPSEMNFDIVRQEDGTYSLKAKCVMNVASIIHNGKEITPEKQSENFSFEMDLKLSFDNKGTPKLTANSPMQYTCDFSNKEALQAFYRQEREEFIQRLEADGYDQEDFKAMIRERIFSPGQQDNDIKPLTIEEVNTLVEELKEKLIEVVNAAYNRVGLSHDATTWAKLKMLAGEDDKDYKNLKALETKLFNVLNGTEKFSSALLANFNDAVSKYDLARPFKDPRTGETWNRLSIALSPNIGDGTKLANLIQDKSAPGRTELFDYLRKNVISEEEKKQLAFCGLPEAVFDILTKEGVGNDKKKLTKELVSRLIAKNKDAWVELKELCDSGRAFNNFAKAGYQGEVTLNENMLNMQALKTIGGMTGEYIMQDGGKINDMTLVCRHLAALSSNDANYDLPTRLLSDEYDVVEQAKKDLESLVTALRRQQGIECLNFAEDFGVDFSDVTEQEYLKNLLTAKHAQVMDLMEHVYWRDDKMLEALLELKELAFTAYFSTQRPGASGYTNLRERKRIADALKNEGFDSLEERLYIARKLGLLNNLAGIVPADKRLEQDFEQRLRLRLTRRKRMPDFEKRLENLQLEKNVPGLEQEDIDKLAVYADFNVLEELVKHIENGDVLKEAAIRQIQMMANANKA